MTETTVNTVDRLEEIEERTAWHRAIAGRTSCSWMREARLLAAEDHERQAAHMRDQVARREALLSSAIERREARDEKGGTIIDTVVRALSSHDVTVF